MRERITKSKDGEGEEHIHIHIHSKSTYILLYTPRIGRGGKWGRSKDMATPTYVLVISGEETIFFCGKSIVYFGDGDHLEIAPASQYAGGGGGASRSKWDGEKREKNTDPPPNPHPFQKAQTKPLLSTPPCLSGLSWIITHMYLPSNLYHHRHGISRSRFPQAKVVENAEANDVDADFDVDFSLTDLPSLRRRRRR